MKKPLPKERHNFRFTAVPWHPHRARPKALFRYSSRAAWGHLIIPPLPALCQSCYPAFFAASAALLCVRTFSATYSEYRSRMLCSPNMRQTVIFVLSFSASNTVFSFFFSNIYIPLCISSVRLLQNLCFETILSLETMPHGSVFEYYFIFRPNSCILIHF